MAFPIIRASSQGSQNANSTTHAITLPTHADGDLLLVWFSVDGNPGLTLSSTSWRVLAQAVNGTIVTGALIAKRATSSNESLTITTSASEQSTHICHSVMNAHNPVVVNSSNGSSTNSNPPGSPAVPRTSDYLVICSRHGDSNVNATVEPTNYSNLDTRTASGTGGASTAIATREINISSGSSEDPGTFTSNTEQWVCFTIVLEKSPDKLKIVGTNGNWADAIIYTTRGGLTAQGWGQCFKGDGQTIRKAAFAIYKIGSPTGTLTAYIYAMTGTFGTSGVPTGSALATSTNTKSASDISTTVQTHYFDFDGFTAREGVNYVVVLQSTVVNDGTNSYNFASPGLGSDGAGNDSTWNGTTWTQGSGDYTFFAFVDEHSLIDAGASWASALLTSAGSAPSSITESATPTHSQDRTFDTFPAQTESAAATDSPNRTLDTFPSITESASATESSDGGLSASASITESISATDSSDRAYTGLGTQSESATSSDAQTVTMDAIVSRTEPLTATDAPTSTFDALSSRTEPVSATDSPDRTLNTTVSQSESLSATESANGVTTGNISESVSATDSQNSNFVTTASQTDTASATDTPTSNFVTTASDTESAAASDSPTAGNSTSSAITESASSTESSDASKTGGVNADITESVSATESSSSTYSTTSTRTETTSATDSPSAIWNGSAIISETITSTHTQTGDRTTNSAITEAITATDSSSRTLSTIPTISESVTASDTSSSVYTTSSSLSESSSPSDSYTLTITYQGNQIESLTATHTQDQLTGNTYNVSVSEPLILTITQEGFFAQPIFFDSKITSALNKESAISASISALSRVKKEISAESLVY